jgi:DNA-binding transcriptional regulator YiaG
MVLGDKIERALLEFADALERGKKITRKFKCHKVILNLHPVPYSPAKVKATRKLIRASQDIFAQFLGVSPGALRAWEQGRQPPPDMACRFMDEIQRNPDYFRRIMREAVRVTTA